MTPTLNGIDHIHLYVRDLERSKAWYERVLGLRPAPALEVWAVGDGPHTLEDASGRIHLALFERSEPRASSAVAFNASASQFLAYRTHLEREAIDVRLADHAIAWSMYFSDPDDHLHEITTYDYEGVAEQLNG